MKRRRALPTYVSAFSDRHGTERYRFRRAGFKATYINHPLGSREFWEEYEALKDGRERIQVGADRVVPGTIDDLMTRFYRSSSWTTRPVKAQAHDRRILEKFRAEHGAKMVANLKFEHVDGMLAARAHVPEMANKLRKQLRRLMAYALAIGMIDRDPTALSKAMPSKGNGWHTWSEEEIAQFQERHPIGTKARLALELMLWTSQRKSDAIRMGRQHIKDGRIRIVQEKTGTELKLAVAPQLLEAIVSMPPNGHLTFLVNELGRPFTRAGFGNWFRKRCDEADLPQCAAHGLRKAMSRRLAEINQSNQSIKSVTGHRGDSEVARYTRGASQTTLADAAIRALSEWEVSNRKSGLDIPPEQEADNV